MLLREKIAGNKQDTQYNFLFKNRERKRKKENILILRGISDCFYFSV